MITKKTLSCIGVADCAGGSTCRLDICCNGNDWGEGNSQAYSANQHVLI
jgi:hypothetical protein